MYRSREREFTTLNNSFLVLSSVQQGASITVSIKANSTKTTADIISAGSWTSLIISLSGGAGRNISGNVAGHMINLQ
ncbi:MAG TPA: hypothetical protein PK509_03910 [Catalimonadaceae bacterium]|nr:hypothetical protein [Catalimonadaceae bacterium]